MTERPILFSAEMVRAILEGRKTQTRRAIKPVPTFNGGGACHDADALQQDYVEPYWVFPKICKYGAPGDLLWVRETWFDPQMDGGRVLYAADQPEVHPIHRRRPSIHMPRWASRITLRITDVRVERLQDISEDDAIAEGVKPCTSTGWNGENLVVMTAREAFADLWNDINGPGAWDANPWVWVIAFERVKP
jgi:hypothetical protein